MDTTNKNPNANYFDLGQGGNPAVITMDSLTPKTPINLSPIPTVTDSNIQVPDYNKLVESFTAPTPEATKVEDTRGNLQKLVDRITGRGAMVTDSGINTETPTLTARDEFLKRIGYKDSADAMMQLKDINNQLNTLSKEELAIPLKIGEEFKGTGATQSGVAPIQASRLRENAIKRLSLASTAEAIQGNISTASALAEEAIKREFAPLEAELNALKFNYQQNKDALERKDKEKANLLNLALGERERLLNNQKEDKKTILGFVAEGAKNGAPTLLLERARQTNNPIEALTILGQYMSDPTAKAQALANLTKTRAEITKINNEIENQGLSNPITNPNSEKYAGAISVVLGSSKLTKDQKNDFVRAVNNGEEPVAVIKNKARELMTGTNATDTEKYETIKSQIESLDSQLTEFYANGGNTNIFRGNFEKVINNLGQVNDPKLVTLAVQIASSLQSYRNAISGTAYSEQEGKDIASIFPGINKSEGLNKAIIDGRLAFINDTIDANYRRVLGSTYDTVKQLGLASSTETKPQNLSIDDAFAEYQKMVNSNIQPVQTKTETKPQIPNLLPDMSGYKGFTLDSIFNFKK